MFLLMHQDIVVNPCHLAVLWNSFPCGDAGRICYSGKGLLKTADGPDVPGPPSQSAASLARPSGPHKGRPMGRQRSGARRRNSMRLAQPATFWIAVSAVALVALVLLHQIPLPFVVGALLAYLLVPAVDRLDAPSKDAGAWRSRGLRYARSETAQRRGRRRTPSSKTGRVRGRHCLQTEICRPGPMSTMAVSLPL